MDETTLERASRSDRGRALRAGVMTSLIIPGVFFGLRWLESSVTYHPEPYRPGPRWTPPRGGEDVYFQVASGERLHGWFVGAANRPAWATVLYCHGNGGNVTNVGWVAESLAEMGLDVLVFDYRGYGRSEGALSDEWGLYADAEAAYNYLLGERGARAERLIVYGLSLGTTAAIEVAARRGCGALVVESGLSSASEMAEVAFPWLPRWMHRLGRNRFESARKIAGVACPVLVTHGTMDRTIPIAQGRALYAAAREPKELMIVDGGDHNLVGAGGRDYLQKIAAFARKALE